jgi:hypothetical protein
MSDDLCLKPEIFLDARKRACALYDGRATNPVLRMTGVSPPGGGGEDFVLFE